MNVKQSFSPALVLISSLGLIGCGSDSNSSSPTKVDCSDCAVITSVAADNGSSSIDFSTTSFPFVVQKDFAKQDLTDVRAVTYGDNFYRVGRYQQDNISKWSFDDTTAPIWEFSLGAYSNPYEVIFISESKAYILLWGENEILIFDPSVSSNSEESNFEVGSIDLSAYDQGQGSNAAAAILDNGYLYVVLEGLDENYAPETSYLLKIDTMTDAEVDVNGAEDGNGYALTVKNAGDIELLGETIYASGKGRYGAPPELTGGIEKVNISSDTFTSSVLIDDDNVNIAAQITGIEIASETEGYLTRYNAWQSIDIIGFNPTTGAVDAQPLENYTGIDIRFIEIDEANQLWIGLGSTSSPRINIISTIDNSPVGSIPLSRIPIAVKFADTTN